MGKLGWIITSGILMSLLTLVGAFTIYLSEARIKKVMIPLVAFSSGTLIGSALFNMIPAAVEIMGNHTETYVFICAGFVFFLILEQFLHLHHCHRPASEHKQPVTYLILVADGVHNLVGGVAIGALFIADVRLGISAWIAAAAHEIPQELGDFGVLVHGGWKRSTALLFNFYSGLTFLVGGLIAYFASAHADLNFLIPFAAGNFLYIGAVDLVPEFKERCSHKRDLLNPLSFLLGMGLLLLVRVLGHHH